MSAPLWIKGQGYIWQRKMEYSAPELSMAVASGAVANQYTGFSEMSLAGLFRTGGRDKRFGSIPSDCHKCLWLK